ncbi:MAG: fatty acyl-AMP ligase [Deltaproteobacteria bacterium]|nr:fatty acyl-AMP ligase [Deltaproteobacteria bacterium]
MTRPPPASLVELLRRRAEGETDRVAYTFLADGETEQERVTYGELDRRSRAIAALLRRRHRPGERALLLYPSGLDFIAAFFGCLYAGLIAVPAYPPRPNREPSRLRGILRDAEPAAVLGTEAAVEGLAELAAVLPELTGARWLATDHLPLSEAEHWEDPSLGPDATAFLQYTSGSTAEPKGVMVSHANLLHNLAYANHVEENDASSVGVSWLPFYHDMGLIEAVLQPAYGGYPAFLMAPAAFLQEPLRWVEALSRYRGTNSGGPNFAFELCVRKTAPEERARLDLSSWRVAYNGAEPIRWETLERFYRAFQGCGLRWRSLYPVYGLAEATLLVSSGRRSYEPRPVMLDAERLAEGRAVEPRPGAAAARFAACGPCGFGTKVAIVRPETRERCGPGEIGEIWVQGPSVAQGYWGRPDENRLTFGAELAEGEGPFLRTGDLGFLDGDDLVVTGRLKDLIVVRGRKHYPQDIERTVEACHASIRTGCVAAFGLEAGGEEGFGVAAEVERTALRAKNGAGLDGVLGAVREAVGAQHELPLRAVFLLRPGSLPKTSSGKLRRHACREGLRAGSLSAAACWVERPATGGGVRS